MPRLVPIRFRQIQGKYNVLHCDVDLGVWMIAPDCHAGATMAGKRVARRIRLADRRRPRGDP
jgi:hypothetical protein